MMNELSKGGAVVDFPVAENILHDSADLMALFSPLITRANRRTHARKNTKDAYAPRPVDEAFTPAKLRSHVNGWTIRGLYHVPAGGSVCRWATLDLDDHGGESVQEDMFKVAARLRDAATLHGLRAVGFTSKSGRGVHLHFLWEDDQDAYSVRELLRAILKECGLEPGTKGVASGQVEIFPKQNAVAEGFLGNFVNMPLAGPLSVPLAVDLLDGSYVLGRRDDCLSWREGEKGWLLSDDVPFCEGYATSREVAVRDPDSVRDVVLEGEAADLAARWLGALGEDYARDYDKWLQVGMALRGGYGDAPWALELWDTWSAEKGGGEYEPGMCETKWRTFGGREGLTERSLFYWAVQEGYEHKSGPGDFDLVIPGGKDAGLLDLEGAWYGVHVEGPAFDREKRKGYARAYNSMRNLRKALHRPDICGMGLGFDEFIGRMAYWNYLGRLRQGSAWQDAGEGLWVPFEDEDFSRFRVNLEYSKVEDRGIFEPIRKGDLIDAAALVARDNKFSSSRTWMESIEPWDGTPRLSSFCVKYMGLEDTPYHSAWGLYLMTAAAGRAYDGAVKADIVPVLVGDEGERKTSFCKALVPDEVFYGELDFEDGKDDTVRKGQGKLIREWVELKGFLSRAREYIKAYITMEYDELVPKYANLPKRLKRFFLIIGTTNEKQFLDALDKNRRFGPVTVGHWADAPPIDTDAIIRDRDQLWAEGLAKYKEHGVLWQELEELAQAELPRYVMDHPWDSLICDLVAVEEQREGSEVGYDRGEGVFIPAARVLDVLGFTGKSNLSGVHSRIVNGFLQRQGYERAQKRIGGVPTRGYFKKGK